MQLQLSISFRDGKKNLSIIVEAKFMLTISTCVKALSDSMAKPANLYWVIAKTFRHENSSKIFVSHMQR